MVLINGSHEYPTLLLHDADRLVDGEWVKAAILKFPKADFTSEQAEETASVAKTATVSEVEATNTYRFGGVITAEEDDFQTSVWVELRGIDRYEYVSIMQQQGAAMVQGAALQTEEAPPAEVGVFGLVGYPVWEPGTTYARNQLVSHEGAVYYIKQPELTAQDIYPPGSVGTEALYGARPKMNPDGTYPYRYNMAAAVGMRVWSSDGATLYECIQAIPDMLFPPESIPAHFREVVE